MHRIVAFGATDKNPRLREMLKSEQQNITDEYALLLRKAQENGWISQNVDAYASAVFVQAMTIGRIVDDVSEIRSDEEKWTEVSEKALLAILW